MKAPPDLIRSGIIALMKYGMTTGTDDIVLIIDEPICNGSESRDYTALNDAFRSLKPFSLYILDTIKGL
jgi:hypothetical protein